MGSVDGARGRPAIQRAWRAAIAHQVLAGVTTAAIIAVGSGAYAIIRNAVNERSPGVPVEVTVSGVPTSAFVAGVPSSPPDVARWDLVATDGRGPLAWVEEVGGGGAGVVKRRLVFVGRAEATIVTGMRARILDRLAPAAAVVEYLVPEGANAFGDVVDATIVLDQADPVAHAVNSRSGDASRPLFEAQTLSLQRGESQTIDVALTGCDCTFELEVTVVTDGRESTVTVPDGNGRPFRVVRVADDLPRWELGRCPNGSHALVDGSGACVPFPSEPGS